MSLVVARILNTFLFNVLVMIMKPWHLMLRETMIFYDVEPIEEFIAWKGAYKISSLIENDDDAPYKSKSFPILYTLHLESQPNHCFITHVTSPSTTFSDALPSSVLWCCC